MKRLPSFCAALGLLAWPFSAVRADLRPDYQPMRIDQTWEPGFPIQATDLNLSSGEANVVVAVDATGQVTDALVVAYSHPVFAATAMLAVKRWKYEPARLDGQPVASTKEIAFRFEEHGVVLVTLTATEMIQAHMGRMVWNDTSYRAYTINDLDRPLTPTHLVNPSYPMELRARGIRGTVTLNYFVDEEGRVRMPLVVNQAPPELAGLAVAAARQWLFDPPTRHGRPVLIRVSQSIRFNPAP